MPEDFSVFPCGFARGTDAPGGDRVFQMGDRRKRVAEQPDVQLMFGGFDEAVERAVERSVVVVLRSAVLRR